MKKVVLLVVFMLFIISFGGCISSKQYVALQNELEVTKKQLSKAQKKMLLMEDALQEQVMNADNDETDYQTLEQVKYQMILNESDLRALKTKLEETENQLIGTHLALSKARADIVKVKVQAAKARLEKARVDLEEAEKEVNEARVEMNLVEEDK